ncbi:hypothetical protein N9X05_17905 [Paracoccaceae bacterium]|nr:hypothetical protein [Paracoccaceae bacterium]
MRASIIALMLMFGSQAGAECGNLCDEEWWSTAAEAELQDVLDGGADVMARGGLGDTPLHDAVECFRGLLICDVGRVQVLLHAGADAKAKNKEGKTPWDYAQNNERLKGTKNYWALNDAQYN